MKSGSGIINIFNKKADIPPLFFNGESFGFYPRKYLRKSGADFSIAVVFIKPLTMI